MILHAYEEWGGACVRAVERDVRVRDLGSAAAPRLLLARDRLGVKPLYYWSDGRTLAFASELKALLAHPDVPRALDRQALRLVPAHEYVPSPRSIFAGIRKLPAGHVLRVPLDGARRGRARRSGGRNATGMCGSVAARAGARRSVEEYADELRELLRRRWRAGW